MASQKPMKVEKFTTWCPCGEHCTKGKSRLGTFPSEQEAREKVMWHLMESPYHKLSTEDAKEMADVAQIESWFEEAAPLPKMPLPIGQKVPQKVSEITSKAKRSVKSKSRSRERKKAREQSSSVEARKEKHSSRSSKQCQKEDSTAAIVAQVGSVVAQALREHCKVTSSTSAASTAMPAELQPLVPQDAGTRIIAAVTRAEASARTAARMARAAASAFEEEAHVLVP